MINRQIGSLHTGHGQPFIQIDRDEAGFAVLGAPEIYQPGIYSVTFNITPIGDVSDGDNFCGSVDITAADPKMIILEKTNLFVNRLRRQKGRVALNFNLTRAMRLRFRVHSSGAVSLKVSTEKVVAPISSIGYAPILDPEERVDNEFFRDNFQRFRSIYENGVELTLGETVIANCCGVSFHICTVDACQLVNGIFFGNMYNFSSKRNVLAVDIGMNIGLTSLYMARDPHVIEVHAFEPFHIPFNRAIENFALNPELSKKITPANIGLAGVNEELSVLSSPEKTIGRSIKGLLTGTPEKITIRDVTEIFQELISKARANDWEIIAKIDCEGSEFPIFQGLAGAGMLRNIRAVMTEWHKKGSTDKSQREIVRPLIENNFMIFDRTNPNRDAGMLYAVRTM